MNELIEILKHVQEQQATVKDLMIKSYGHDIEMYYCYNGAYTELLKLELYLSNKIDSIDSEMSKTEKEAC